VDTLNSNLSVAVGGVEMKEGMERGRAEEKGKRGQEVGYCWLAKIRLLHEYDWKLTRE